VLKKSEACKRQIEQILAKNSVAGEVFGRYNT
jgi:hypothetical protein